MRPVPQALPQSPGTAKGTGLRPSARGSLAGSRRAGRAAAPAGCYPGRSSGRTETKPLKRLSLQCPVTCCHCSQQKKITWEQVVREVAASVVPSLEKKLFFPDFCIRRTVTFFILVFESLHLLGLRSII